MFPAVAVMLAAWTIDQASAVSAKGYGRDNACPYEKATLLSQLPLEALPLAFVPTVTGKGRR